MSARAHQVLATGLVAGAVFAALATPGSAEPDTPTAPVGATTDPLFAYDFGAAGRVHTTLPPCVRFTG